MYWSSIRRRIYGSCRLEMVFLDVRTQQFQSSQALTITRNVPIGAAVPVSIFSVKLKPSSNQTNRILPISEKLQHMDALGSFLFLGSISCLLLVLQWGGHTIRWQGSRAIGLFIGFGLLLGLFGFLQWKRGEYATIPVRILRKRSILMGALFRMPLGMPSTVVCFPVANPQLCPLF